MQTLIQKIRADFPILSQQIFEKPLVYLDNAATTQKPWAVLNAMTRFYELDNANVHRGVHLLSQRATDAYEAVRHRVQQFIHAAHTTEIVFTKGTTDAINCVAHSYGRTHLKAGDEILITAMEHHANIVPWQLLCESIGTVLKVVPIKDNGDLDLESFKGCITAKTKLISMVYVSNALGTVNPVAEIIQLAHASPWGYIPVLIDAAQAVLHRNVNVQTLDCDFLAFSAHKLCSATGVGILYGKQKWLATMPPYQSGGDMIDTVTFEKTTFREPPFRFEAGTPNIAGVIGLGAAIDYLQSIPLSELRAHEVSLTDFAVTELKRLPGVTLIGEPQERSAVISFVVDGIHPHDVASILDREGIAVRAGHHCAMPLMKRFKVPALTRASIAFYNTEAEVESLIEGLKKVQRIFHV